MTRLPSTSAHPLRGDRVRRFALLLFILLARPVFAADCPPEPVVVTSPSLTIATLNIAHGRKDARNQLFVREERFRANLLELAALMDRAEADVIALQEADAPSRWSGRFDHVAFLAEHSRYGCTVHGVHASNRLYSFGTALLAPHRMENPRVHDFEPSWPTTNKGFTQAELAWNPEGQLETPLRVRFASVHLDFSRRSVRRAQIDEMVAVVGAGEGPLVLMGDFNTDWQTPGSSLKDLADRLGLMVYEPHAEGLATYGDKGARLDWILVSPEFRFERYAVYPDIVSDHYAVAAVIALAGE